MRRLILTLSLMLSAALCLAQPTVQPSFGFPLVSDYELDSTSYIYCQTADTSGRLWTHGNEMTVPVTTSGSSTTVAAAVASSGPFTNVAVGDELEFNLDGVMELRYVAARASANSITVNSAINLGDGRRGTSGYGFWYRTLTCATTATVGWVPVRSNASVTWSVEVTQMDATSIDATLYCRNKGSIASTGQQAWTHNYTAAGGDFITIQATGGIKIDECRMGLKINTDDGADTTTHAEKITIQVEG